MNNFCKTLAVSQSAAAIRMKQLGYLEEKPLFDFHDPLDVWP